MIKLSLIFWRPGIKLLKYRICFANPLKCPLIAEFNFRTTYISLIIAFVKFYSEFVIRMQRKFNLDSIYNFLGNNRSEERTE